MEKEIKAVAYVRVSSKEQAEKDLSIPAQLEAIRNYCEQKGWSLIHEYIDAGKSAKTDDRPEFQQMIAQAKKQNRDFNAIIVHKYDRFSRSRDDHIIYKSLLKKIGISVYSVTEQTDPETPHGFLLEGIMEVISEFYNMNLKAETIKGLQQNAKLGYHNGGRAPYGYRLSRITNDNSVEKTQYILGPDEEVAAVRRIFSLRAYEHFSYKKIATILNGEGIPSFYGGKWPVSSIRAILENEAYIGNLVWNMVEYSSGKKKPESEWIRVENAHPAIVSKEEFSLIKSLSKSKVINQSTYHNI